MTLINIQKIFFFFFFLYSKQQDRLISLKCSKNTPLIFFLQYGIIHNLEEFHLGFSCVSRIHICWLWILRYFFLKLQIIIDACCHEKASHQTIHHKLFPWEAFENKSSKKYDNTKHRGFIYLTILTPMLSKHLKGCLGLSVCHNAICNIFFVS